MASEAADPLFLRYAVQGSLALVALLTLASSYRVIRGPTVPDRVVALDTIATNVVAIAILYALASGSNFFVLVGLVLAIVAFISTVTVAKYVIEGDIIQ